MAEHEVKDRIEDQIRAVIYGQCVGDALGLLTEFMPKKEAKSVSIFHIYSLYRTFTLTTRMSFPRYFQIMKLQSI